MRSIRYPICNNINRLANPDRQTATTVTTRSDEQTTSHQPPPHTSATQWHFVLEQLGSFVKGTLDAGEAALEPLVGGDTLAGLASDQHVVHGRERPDGGIRHG